MVTGESYVLQTEELCLSYGRQRVVDELGLSVRAGEIYGFLGRNGAGKTSTIRMLMGVIRPDAGSIRLLDFHGRRIGTAQKRRIGYVSQEQHFYPWMTGRALGRFVGGFYPTWDHAEFARLLAWLDLPPDRKVAHLSGGMKVKLALALALAHRPPLLILDEPTAGLDPVARREFLEIIQRQAREQQRTTFFSSHLIDEVERVADRVGILHHGRLQYEGDIATLRASVREVRYDRPEAVVQVAVPLEPPSAATPDDAPPDGPRRVAPVEPAEELPDRTAGAGPLPDSVLEIAVPVDPRQDLARRAEAAGFRVLRGGFDGAPSLLLQARPERWNEAPFPPESVQTLSLEDAFIALASDVR